MLANLILVALPLVATYLLTAILRRRKQFLNFPQLKSSLLWGHGQTIHEYIKRGPPKVHIGRFYYRHKSIFPLN
jgi:hypothetical protein